MGRPGRGMDASATPGGPPPPQPEWRPPGARRSLAWRPRPGALQLVDEAGQATSGQPVCGRGRVRGPGASAATRPTAARPGLGGWPPGCRRRRSPPPRHQAACRWRARRPSPPAMATATATATSGGGRGRAGRGGSARPLGRRRSSWLGSVRTRPALTSVAARGDDLMGRSACTTVRGTDGGQALGGVGGGCQGRWCALAWR